MQCFADGATGAMSAAAGQQSNNKRKTSGRRKSVKRSGDSFDQLSLPAGKASKLAVPEGRASPASPPLAGVIHCHCLLTIAIMSCM